VFFARDTARGFTPKRRGSARLLPLFIKRRTSYIKHVPMDPFSYLSVLISIILALGMTRLGSSPALLGARRLGRESVSVSGGGVVDFLSLAQPAAVDIFPFYLCPDFTAILYLASIVLFPPESSLDDFVNYKTQYYSNYRVFFILFAVSRRSISSIPC
jgi:hypothetical protein